MAGSRSGKRRRKLRKQSNIRLEKAIKRSDDKTNDFKEIPTQSLKVVYTRTYYFGINTPPPFERYKGPEVFLRKVKKQYNGTTYKVDTALHIHKKKVTAEEYAKHVERQKNKPTKEVKAKQVTKQSQPAKHNKPTKKVTRKQTSKVA